MKRFILMITFILFSVCCYSQTYCFETTKLAIKYKGEYFWEEWSDWEPVSIKIKINCDDNLITIYSKETQSYKILESKEINKKLYISSLDKDGLKCTVILKKNPTQIYINYSDVCWVYELKNNYTKL